MGSTLVDEASGSLACSLTESGTTSMSGAGATSGDSPGGATDGV